MILNVKKLLILQLQNQMLCLVWVETLLQGLMDLYSKTLQENQMILNQAKDKERLVQIKATFLIVQLRENQNDGNQIL